MQHTQKEIFKAMRKHLPYNYATILFRHYKRKKVQVSKSLIFKVAYGERNNVIILSDLIELATQNREILKRLGKFEKRLRKIKIKK
jgi:hypothetical protein